jgi:RHS repeat-associated protein
LITVNTVNGRGLPTQITDPNGVVTDMTYDFQGRMLTATVNPGASAAVTTMTYDAIGQVTRVTRPGGAYLNYTYDNARRLTTITANSGETITYTYDLMGNVTGTVIRDAANVIAFNQTQTYDELGRLLKHIGANSQNTIYGYDKTSLLTSVTDPRGGVYGYAYDGLQRLIRETDQGSAQVNVTRTAQDDVATYTDPRSLTTTYTRNGFGEVKRRVNPDTGTTNYVYDARSLLTQMTDARADARAVVTNYTYDNAGRMLTKSFPTAAAENVTYTYDSVLAGNKGKGRLTSVTDESGSTAYVYDVRGNVLSETRVIAGQSYAVAYQYDTADRVTQITYPSGRIVTYTRDAQGRVTGVTTKKTAAATTSDTVVSGVTWKPFSGLPFAMTMGNGVTELDTYSLDYEIQRLLVQNGAASLLDRTHNRTDLLNLTGITDAVTPANNQTFGYTPANRLSTASGVYGAQSWTYDGVGNRTAETSGGTAKTYSYLAINNRLATIVQGATTLRTFTHDAQGNITQDNRSGAVYDYSYNKNNRLKTVTVAGNLKATYTYDAREQLAIRVLTNMTPSGTIHSVYDRQGNLLMESNGLSTGITREYVWLPGAEIAPMMNAQAPIDRPLAVVDAVNTASPVVYWVQVDHLNRPAQMTNAAKSNVWSATWQPFGAPQAITGSASLDARFPGQWFQLESGLHVNWWRHYDPTTGRFTQADPLGFVDGPSVYGYANGAATVFVDPDGRVRICASVYCVDITSPPYEDADRIRRWGHQRFPGDANSAQRHCTASCLLAKRHGTNMSRAIGVGNEVQGLVLHDIPNLPSRLNGSRPWAFSPSDLVENERGFAFANQCPRGTETDLAQCLRQCTP